MGPPRVVALTPNNDPQRGGGGGHLHRAHSSITPSSGGEVQCCTRPRREHNHFFYPRTPRNRELLDTELPCTDTVKRTRSFFESKSPIRAPLWTDTGSVSSGVSSADLSSPACKTESFITSGSEAGSDWEEEEEEELLSSADEIFDRSGSPPHVVPAGVMDRIRSRCSSVTYFGGRIVASSIQPVSPTRMILTEIQRSSEYQAWLHPGSGLPRRDFATVRSKRDGEGLCRLVKSNSCDSRLEIIALQQQQQQQQTSPRQKQQHSARNTPEGVRSRSRSEAEVPAVCNGSDTTSEEDTWDWPGKSSVLFDFCTTPRHPSASAAAAAALELPYHRPRKRQPLSGVVASAHARLAASTTTL